MKASFLILFFTLFSVACFSQTNSSPTVKPLYCSSKSLGTTDYTKTINSKLNLNKTFSLYELQNNPTYAKEMYYNNSTHSGKEMMYIYHNRFYSVANLAQQSGSIQSSLFCGTFNYLLLLLNVKQ
ncbi:MAG: hypothetical protein WCP52_13605 [Bacteroidota bacterium]